MGEGVLVTETTVRRARRSDEAAVRGLLEGAGLPREGVVEALETSFEVAEAGGVVVGVAGLEVHDRYGLLRSVAVDPARRGTGTGEALVRSRLAEAKRLGLARVYLLTTTAEAWFPRFGFRSVGRTEIPHAVEASQEFAGLCPSTAAVMALDLVGDHAAGQQHGAASAAVGALQAVVRETYGAGDADAALKAVVREKYGAAARAAAGGARASCCAPEPVQLGIAQQSRARCCGGDKAANPITDDLYEEAQTSGLPAEAVLASLGCGNPTALAELNPGEVVLDLGSGGGIDVLLSARRVGPTGKAYGLDMTDDMLELARANQARAGVQNVEFLKGDIEAIPLPDASVDVIISNCVINLAADKSRVLREAFRVLRPGGRFAVSDVVRRRDVPEPVRRSMELWVGCVAGALHEREYARLLAEAGFADVDVEPTRIYGTDDAGELLAGAGIDAGAADLDGAFMSAFVRARKPSA
jgi:arsenite methyltransferase